MPRLTCCYQEKEMDVLWAEDEAGTESRLQERQTQRKEKEAEHATWRCPNCHETSASDHAVTLQTRTTALREE